MLEDQTLSARKNIQLIISIWLALGAVHKNEKKKDKKRSMFDLAFEFFMVGD